MGLLALEIIVEQLIIKKSGEKDKKEGSAFDFRANILSESNRLSLFLGLKEIYIQDYSGLSKEYEEIFSYKVLSDRKNLKLLQGLVSRQTHLFPRLHSCIPLLLKIEIGGESKSAD